MRSKNLLPSDSVKFEEIFYIEKYVEGAGELAVGSGSDHTYKTYLPWSPPPRGLLLGFICLFIRGYCLFTWPGLWPSCNMLECALWQYFILDRRPGLDRQKDSSVHVTEAEHSRPEASQSVHITEAELSHMTETKSVHITVAEFLHMTQIHSVHINEAECLHMIETNFVYITEAESLHDSG